MLQTIATTKKTVSPDITTPTPASHRSHRAYCWGSRLCGLATPASCRSPKCDPSRFSSSGLYRRSCWTRSYGLPLSGSHYQSPNSLPHSDHYHHQLWRCCRLRVLYLLRSASCWLAVCYNKCGSGSMFFWRSCCLGQPATDSMRLGPLGELASVPECGAERLEPGMSELACKRVEGLWLKGSSCLILALVSIFDLYIK